MPAASGFFNFKIVVPKKIRIGSGVQIAEDCERAERRSTSPARHVSDGTELLCLRKTPSEEIRDPTYSADADTGVGSDSARTIFFTSVVSTNASNAYVKKK
ncbi:MAG: hypothetical protein EOP09_14225 [Proteobacteria bacterium]|nr:MAG: hypothetical protein EOP09_14225 [Pseudomonadota bacterium]